MPVVHYNRCLTVQKTVEIPQLLLVLFGPGRRHLCRGAETNSYGCSGNHRNSTVAVH